MKKSKKNQFIIVIVVIILLIFFNQIGVFKQINNLIVSVTLPIQKIFYNWGLSFTSFRNYKLLVEENNLLKKEVSSLSVDYIKLADLEAENNYLKNELNYLVDKEYEFQVANVIGYEPLNKNIIIINEGSKSGIKINSAVTVSQGIIVGKIIKVEDRRSFVGLLTDTNSQLAVTISSLIGTNGLLKGKAGNSLQMDLIPQDKEVRQDDLVITSGLEETIPRGLLIGRISQVESLIGKVFKQARVASIVNYDSLQILTVIKAFN